MTDLLDLSGLEQAALVRQREVSAAELVDAHIAQVERHDAAARAFVWVGLDRARARATRMDRRLARRSTDVERLGPLFGVPYGVKDTEPMRAAPFVAGARAFRYVWSPVDAPLVRRTKRLGVNVVGKTSTSELALMPVVETDLQPPTVNPWSLTHTAGGSSGGSASAVAAAMLPLASASDGAGSIRIPASLCHLFGYKPSRDLLPRFYRAVDPVGLAEPGSVTHTVEDAACVLDGLLGRRGAYAEPGSLRAACARAPRRLRVGLCVTSPLVEVGAAQEAAVRRVGAALAEMGHHVEEFVGAHQGTVEEFIPIYGRLLANPPVPFESMLQPVTRWMRAQGRTISQREAITRTATLADDVATWFGDFDLAITPTVASDPPLAGAWSSLPPDQQFLAAVSLGAFTAPFNLSGQPAASIPSGCSGAGLPVGVQVVGRRGGDAELLSVCAALEAALPWRARQSPMALSR